MCGTRRDPTVAVLLGGASLDESPGVEMNETPAMAIARDAGLGGQDGVLAVGAEHFGS